MRENRGARWKLGGGAIAVASAVYGLFKHFNDFLSAGERLWGWREAFAATIPWLWVAGVLFGVAVLLWGDPRKWVLKKPYPFISLNELIVHVATNSNWVLHFRDVGPAPDKGDTPRWVESLRTEIRDELSLGNLQAQGRPVFTRFGERRTSALELIPAEDWRHALLHVRSAIDCPDGPSRIKTGDREWDEIRVIRKHALRIWRPLAPWTRKRLILPWHGETDDDLENGRLIELLQDELD